MIEKDVTMPTETATPTPTPEIVSRIKKLMALADRAGTEHEAALAASKMQELLQEFNLTRAEVEAKDATSRSADYIAKYGPSSWELDALEPAELNSIIRRAVLHYRDEIKWTAAVQQEKRGRGTLKAIYDEFENVVQFLRGEQV